MITKREVSFTDYLAPKIKYCLFIDDYGVIKEHKTFKVFNDSKRLLDRSQYFTLVEGKKYQLCYQDLGKNRLILELLYLQK